MGDQNIQVTQFFKSFDEINFSLIAVIVLGAWLLTAVIERFLPRLANRAPSRIRLHILRLAPVLRLVILTVAIIQFIPQVVRPTSQNLFAIFGAAGFAIGFAIKDYISSLIAGVVSIYERPYRPGDWVQVGEAYGEVRSLGLRTMSMVTPDDTVVTIPHLKIWDTSIHNANDGQRTHLCVADFYLNPKHDATQARQKLREVALTSPYLDLGRSVSVVVSERPWGTHYRLKAYPVDSRQQFQFTSDLTVRGKAALTGLGMEFAVEPLAGYISP